MRIAFLTVEFVTEENRLAGAANFLARTALAMRQLGHEPEVFTWSAEHGRREWQGVPVHRVSWGRGLPHRILSRLCLRRFDHPLLLAQMTGRMKRTLGRRHREEPFDVVHASGSGGTAFASGALGLPTVVRYSGYQPAWLEIEGRKPNAGQRLAWQWEVAAGRRAQRRYAPSRLVADRFRRHHGLPVEVIEPCFVLDVAEPRFCREMLRRFPFGYLLYFGPLSLLKGTDVLARALPLVFRRVGDIHAVFVGEDRGIGGLSAKRVVREAVGPGLADRVHFLDPLPHEQLYPIVQKARCTVIPSRLDNVPNCCLEAMALGQIVVGTEESSLEHLITDGRNGFLVPQENPGRLADVVVRCLRLHPARARHIRKQAIMRIAELHPAKAGRKLVDYLADARVLLCSMRAPCAHLVGHVSNVPLGCGHVGNVPHVRSMRWNVCRQARSR